MSVSVDHDLLACFENGLNTIRIKDSTLPAIVLGYGEISTVFQIGDDTSLAYKRMPLFNCRASAITYIANYYKYCQHLKTAGLQLPEDSCHIVETGNQSVILYIAQKQLNKEQFCHKLIHSADESTIQIFLSGIVQHINHVWEYNSRPDTELEIAIDGQLSNWVWSDSDHEQPLWYIDTSTPLFRINGKEQLDPELFLKSAPSFLRWMIRWLFLKDVMNRYYDPRQVFIDLAANLYKEQKASLIPMALEIINARLSEDIAPLTLDEVEKYYRQDKVIWSLFLAFRRFDRWVSTVLLRRKYVYILPGKISR